MRPAGVWLQCSRRAPSCSTAFVDRGTHHRYIPNRPKRTPALGKDANTNTATTSFVARPTCNHRVLDIGNHVGDATQRDRGHHPDVRQCRTADHNNGDHGLRQPFAADGRGAICGAGSGSGPHQYAPERHQPLTIRSARAHLTSSRSELLPAVARSSAPAPLPRRSSPAPHS